jgi:hypothetical protein
VLLLLEDQAALKRKLGASVGVQDSEVRRLKAQNQALEGLCRGLQARSKGPGAEGGAAQEGPPAGEEGAQAAGLEGGNSTGSVGAEAGWVKVGGADDAAAEGAGAAAAAAAAAAEVEAGARQQIRAEA